MENFLDVVGIENGVNKKYGTPFTILHTMSDFDDYSIENRNALGRKAEITYIRDNIVCSIGDKVRFVYSKGFNNEAVVTGVVLC